MHVHARTKLEVGRNGRFGNLFPNCVVVAPKQFKLSWCLKYAKLPYPIKVAMHGSTIPTIGGTAYPTEVGSTSLLSARHLPRLVTNNHDQS